MAINTSSDFSWQVSGGGKRVSTSKATDSKKPSAKDLTKKATNGPILEQMQPLQFKPTMFDELNDEGEDFVLPPKTLKASGHLNASASFIPNSPKKSKSKADESVHLLTASSTGAQKKKSTGAVTPKKIRSELDSAIDQLKLDDFQREQAQLFVMFPASRSLILQHLSSFLNNKLTHVTDLDSSSSEHASRDYPLTKLDGKIEKFFASIIKQASPQDLEIVADFCFTTLLSEQVKAAHGYKMFVQLMLKHGKQHTGLFAHNLVKYTTILEENKHRHAKCMTAFWTLAQAGYQTSLAKGLKIWFEAMLPFISQKQFTNYVAAYPDSLFSCYKVSARPSSPTDQERHVHITLQQYTQFAELVEDKQALTINNKEVASKLKSSCEVLKRLFAQEISTNGVTTFEGMLAALPSDTSDKMGPVLLELICKNMLFKKEVVQEWSRIYSNYIQNSFILLQYASAVNKKSFGSIKYMREFLSQVDVETSTQMGPSSPDVKKVNPYAKSKSAKVSTNELSYTKKLNGLVKHLLTQHFQRTSFVSMCFRTLLLITLCTGVFFYWDTNNNKSLYTNQAKKQLEHYGLLDQIVQLFDSIKAFGVKVQNLVNLYVPIWFKRVEEVVVPFSKNAWKVTQEYANIALVKSEPYMKMFGEYTKDAQKYVHANWPILKKNLLSFFELTVNYISTILSLIAVYAQQFVDTVGVKLLGWQKGDIEHVFADAMKVVLLQITQFFQWINKYLSEDH